MTRSVWINGRVVNLAMVGRNKRTHNIFNDFLTHTERESMKWFTILLKIGNNIFLLAGTTMVPDVCGQWLFYDCSSAYCNFLLFHNFNSKGAATFYGHRK